MHYTGVGSRETPDKILEVMCDLASKLAENGWTLRSGGAQGADAAFQEGCERAGGGKEIFVPWDGFQDLSHDPDNGFYIIRDHSVINKAESIVSKIHPAWDRLKRGAKALHTRNAFQVLGATLDTPSKMLVCYSEVVGSSISGGTRTAWELAKISGVACVNLFITEELERVNRYLEE